MTIVARGQEKLDALAEAMRSEGHEVSAVALDISDVTAVQALCAEQAASDQGTVSCRCQQRRIGAPYAVTGHQY